MTAFIFPSDYQDIITDRELDTITEGDPAVLKSAERKAISKVQKYLLRKYDIDQLFQPILEEDAGDPETDTRDVTLVEYTIYFALFILFTKGAKRNVPEDRFEQYQEAKEFFQDVRKDMITPGWPLLVDEGTGEPVSPGIRFNSGDTISHYY